MATVSKVPVSRLVKSGDDDGPVKKNRDEYRRAKELEEARKLGSAPAVVELSPGVAELSPWRR